MISKIKSSLLSLPFFICVLLIFNACSMLEQNPGSGSVSFRIDNSTVQKIADAAEQENLMVRTATDSRSLFMDVTISGGFSETKTVPLTTEGTASFDYVPVGVTVTVSATAYYKEADTRQDLYQGQSKPFTVRNGENQVVFVLKRIAGDDDDSGSGSGSGSGSATANVLPENKIYVANTAGGGASTNDGTEGHPLDTIENAVVKIHELIEDPNNSYNSGEEWGIVVMSDLQGGQILSDDADSDVTGFVLASKEATDVKTLNGGFDNSNPGTTLKITSAKAVVLQYIKITGGFNTSGSYQGGGVYYRGEQLVVNTGTEIYGNTATYRGGGIYAAVQNDDDLEVLINGGSIHDNVCGGGAASGMGGGICVEGGGQEGTGGLGTASLAITSGLIKENKADQGGGLCVTGRSNVTMDGGSITQNLSYTVGAGMGGGIFLDAKSQSLQFLMTGGSVTSNSSQYGAGVLFMKSSSSNDCLFGIGGNAQFGATDYFTPVDTYIGLYDNLSSVTVPKIEPTSYATTTKIVDNTINLGSADFAAVCAKFQVKPESDGTLWYVSPGGMLTQDNPNDINCYVAPGGTGNGMSVANAFGSIADAIDYIKDLEDAGQDLSEKDAIIKISGMLTSPQNISQDLGVKSLTIKGYNGIDVSTSEPQDGINAGWNGTEPPASTIGSALTVYTSMSIVIDTLLIKGGYANMSGGGIYVSDKPLCQVKIKNSVIKDNGASRNGGGIYVDQGLVTMESGKITGNKIFYTGNDFSNYGHGGGVYVGTRSSGGTFEMTGGSISGNSCDADGGHGNGLFVKKPDNKNSLSAWFVMGGTAVVNSNNDVYLDSNAVIIIESALNPPTGTTSVAKITPASYSGTVSVLEDENGTLVSSYHDKFTVTADGSTNYVVDENGYLALNNGGSGGNNWSNGVLPQEFSVSATKKVKFSQGNLQYKGGTSPEWRFAEHQYDVVDETDLNIANINAAYDTWIDLFGWGSSGYGAIKPYSVNYSETVSVSGTEKTLYQICYFGSMIGDNANYDWGVYNAISNGGNQAGQWRTLTYSEWNYLFNGRTNYASLRVPARIKETSASTTSIPGIVLLPDGWTSENVPNGVTFTTTVTGSGETRWETNVLTYEEWEQLESAGAVFLPAVGYQTSTGSFEYRDHPSYGTKMYYWTASSYNDETGRDDRWSYTVDSGGTSFYGNTISVSNRMPVRLVKDVE